MTKIGVPSRRFDPILYPTRDGDWSSKYVTALVSSGHQTGSKIGPLKPSARAGADPQSFESISISTADTVGGTEPMFTWPELYKQESAATASGSGVIPEHWPKRMIAPRVGA
jgi:hypothetical protein